MAFLGLRFSRGLESLSRAAALASFTPKDLEALSVNEWEAFADSSADGDDLFPWEKNFYAAHIRPGDSILVVGAGTGRDVLPFLQAGHKVTAMDITPRALATLSERARARRHESALTVTEASIASATLAADSFDIVLFSWFCIGYVPGAAGRAAALAHASAAIRTGGQILLSYIPWQSGLDSARVARPVGRFLAKALGGMAAEEGDHVNVTGSAARPAVFLSHTFRPSEIEDAVRAAGLTIRFHDQPTPAIGRLALTR